MAPNTVLCTLQGPARSLLTAERTALNFFAATVQRRQRNPALRRRDRGDARQGLRHAQNAARPASGAEICGAGSGGENQRIGLYDGILIKENHIMAAGGIAQALAAAREIAPAHVSIQIEVENLDELEQALAGGAVSILLDNMSLADMRSAVERTAGKAALEASGGIDLEHIRAIAETGVDRISVGKLTKDVRAIDLSMRFAL